MLQVSVFALEAINRPKKIGGICSSSLKKICFEKISAEGRIRTLRVGVRIPCPNLFSTEFLNIHASRAYI